MTIRITHTADEGTLVHGTARGDGTNTILKAAGFRWFRTLAVWGIANSIDRQPNHYKIERAAEALRAAGHTVCLEVDDTHRPVAEAEAARAQRQAGRAEALAAKADRRAAAADAAWAAEHRAVEVLPPGGEPIKIGHHSERRHRRAIARAHDATRRAITATEDAHAADERAQVAAAAAARRHNPVTVKNRIDKLQAEQRADQRTLEGHRRVVARTANHTYVDEFGPAEGRHREHIIARMAQRQDEITYWTNIYTAQQDAGLASTHSRDTITKGDLIKYRGHWYTVVRANTKTVSVHLHDGASWTNTIGYHEITGHQRPTAKQDPDPDSRQ
ncbi:DUF3560 domain-containing protein [Mycobacterium eburneum]|nr:DUF3560 domain-containing protein [Mycobacterium eburneum]TDH47220.1 DUF3560 domain-containing protein [Mycobacterium eburneum]